MAFNPDETLLAIPRLAGGDERLDLDTRVRVARLLGYLGSSDAAVIRALLASVRDPALSTGVTGLTAIAKCGPDSVPILIEFLSDARPDLRECACSWLGQAGLPAPDAVDLLCALASDPDLQVRNSAMLALIRLGPATRPALRARMPRVALASQHVFLHEVKRHDSP